MELAMENLTGDPQPLRIRLAAFCRSLSAKALARLIGCDIRTAENIRRGHWPTDRHLERLYNVFGDDLLDAVFRPNMRAARIEQECRHLELLLEAKRVAARAAQADQSLVAPASAACVDPQVRS